MILGPEEISIQTSLGELCACVGEDRDYPKIYVYLMDFSIAEQFGAEAIRDTYRRAFEKWHDNVEYVTELVMLLKWKILEHCGHNDELAALYQELYETADAWCCENLKGDDLGYYYSTTD